MSPLHVHCLHLNSPYCRFRSLNLSEPSIMVTASVLTQRLPSLAPPCGPNNAIPFRLVLLGPGRGCSLHPGRASCTRGKARRPLHLQDGGRQRTRPFGLADTGGHNVAPSLSLAPMIMSPLHPRSCSVICLLQGNLCLNSCHWELGFSHGEPSRDRHTHCSCRGYRAYCTPGPRGKQFAAKSVLFCRPCSSDLSATERLHAGPS